MDRDPLEAQSTACMVPENVLLRYGDRLYGLALRITGVNDDAEAAIEDGRAHGPAQEASKRWSLILHDVEGAAAPDIAEILGVDVPAVKLHVHRARLSLRKRLSEYFARGDAA
jgi:DNA-directed RNA polymerase specialized sigma24 family protein